MCKKQEWEKKKITDKNNPKPREKQVGLQYERDSLVRTIIKGRMEGNRHEESRERSYWTGR